MRMFKYFSLSSALRSWASLCICSAASAYLHTTIHLRSRLRRRRRCRPKFNLSTTRSIYIFFYYVLSQHGYRGREMKLKRKSCSPSSSMACLLNIYDNDWKNYVLAPRWMLRRRSNEKFSFFVFLGSRRDMIRSGPTCNNSNFCYVWCGCSSAHDET